MTVNKLVWTGAAVAAALGCHSAIASPPTVLLRAGGGPIATPLGNVQVRRILFTATSSGDNHSALVEGTTNGDPAHPAPRDVHFLWDVASGGQVVVCEDAYYDLKQGTLEGNFAVSRKGAWVYSANIVGWDPSFAPPRPGYLDSLWRTDGTDTWPLAVQGDICYASGLTDKFWTYASRPAITARNTTYFVAGVTSDNAGVTSLEGLFKLDDDAFEPIAVLRGGSTRAGIGTLSVLNTVGAYGVSPTGDHYVAVVRTQDSTPLGQACVVRDGAVVNVGTLPARQSLLTGLAGGPTDETWTRYRFAGASDFPSTSPSWFFAAETSAAADRNEVIIRNGSLVVREGDTVGGWVLAGPLQSVGINSSGDVMHVWNIVGSDQQIVVLNNSVVLTTGDLVDVDHDGLTTEGATISSIDGMGSATLTDRVASGDLSIYLSCTIDTANTATRADDAAAFIRITVLAGDSPVCPGDFNNNGNVSVQDLFDFLSAYFANNIAADVNHSGSVSVQDIFDFLTLWFGGCH